MSKVEFISVADWNVATDQAMEPGHSVADDPRCLYGWGPSKDGPGPKGCNHRFGHFCDRPFRHPGKCMPNLDLDYLPCEKVQRPKDWDDKVRTECNA